MIPKDLESFITDNNLQQRFGLPEYYSPDGKFRVVIIGKTVRLDKRKKPNWSMYKTMVIFGPAKRNFRVR